MNERLLRLMDKDLLECIQNKNILIIGIGGVGGYVLESLVRTGIKHITIVDYDKIEESNLNRQIISTNNNIGNSKVKEAILRANSINREIDIKSMELRLTKANISLEWLNTFDYIIDACDTVEVKAYLMDICSHHKLKLISCMGTANRFHPEMLEIIKLKNTKGDPLAKKLRTELKNNDKALNTVVVCSKEMPIHQRLLGTVCSVPMSAGSLLSSYVINDILKRNSK